MQDGVNLIDDRGLDPEFTSALKCAARRRDSFGHGFHAGSDLRDRFSLAKLLADAPIPAVAAETGRDQVAGSAEPMESVAFPAHRNAEPEEFGESSSHESSFRVVPQAESVADPGRDREDVFQGTPELDPDEFVAGVNAKAGTPERLLQIRGDLGIAAREHRGGRKPLRDFGREVRPREDSDGIFRKLGGQDLAHAQAGAVLDAFRAAQ